MPNLHEIIKQIQKDLYCPVCGKNYEIGEIKIRGLFDHTLIVQTICDNGHITLFITIFQTKEKVSSISTNYVLDLSNTLEKFDGDFQKLWTR
ncbi:MAG: hypothetical protein US94_C0014G0006 [Berkelbacteria bacterium GW2011_GWB1_38_5]|uniref:Uncharacterized protein n=1 Tax=Berkelbacteria bacterium GW2011_GWB1_38_5 TaxID=1618336 RepID=A0A0G0K328_9BACT|nr:MAG: hypothetical protein US94_C0014G0006 [Berkelbacteria bacterium GW2011_GWB1_38_5]